MGGGNENFNDNPYAEKTREMHMKTKILIFLIILAIMDMVIPVPFTAILLVYVLLERPAWFRNLVRDIYQA